MICDYFLNNTVATSLNNVKEQFTFLNKTVHGNVYVEC